MRLEDLILWEIGVLTRTIHVIIEVKITPVNLNGSFLPDLSYKFRHEF